MKKIETVPQPIKIECQKLFWLGWNVAEIAAHMDVAYGTIDSWKRREKWDKSSPAARAMACAELRYNQLLLKESKSENDYVELERIGKQMERCARMVKYRATTATLIPMNISGSVNSASSRRSPPAWPCIKNGARPILARPRA